MGGCGKTGLLFQSQPVTGLPVKPMFPRDYTSMLAYEYAFRLGFSHGFKQGFEHGKRSREAAKEDRRHQDGRKDDRHAFKKEPVLPIKTTITQM